ncbi:hypothetical protein JOF53_008511 [Crossiella equi]|uniref:GH84 domain-containing protein n=1 Tax=Crossiella equi TaxID=130796 RepID=A0ABS5ASS7_9PSEU|nr:beta-N-acetylglucosaminidase domain-containing protein [Crossiella equi]MBP2479639.1 hypothetical protein [Crossiella equi]
MALGGVDPAGRYYAVQTLRQLFTGDRHRRRIAGATVSDFPAMALHGTIEGFYGSPWTHQERLDQLAFYGQVKANTYIYASKNDPCHRDRWREPYPADRLAQLGELVEAAAARHVRFTYALSPGTSICYSSPEDRAALTAKLQAMYDLGVRAFSIPLDDISYTRRNCAANRTAYGEPGRRAAGVAMLGSPRLVYHRDTGYAHRSMAGFTAAAIRRGVSVLTRATDEQLPSVRRTVAALPQEQPRLTALVVRLTERASSHRRRPGC